MDPSKKAPEHYELNFEYKGTPVQVFKVDACQKTLYSKIKGYILNEEPSMSPGSHGGRLYFEEMIKRGKLNLPPPSVCGTIYCYKIDIIYSESPEKTKVTFQLHDSNPNLSNSTVYNAVSEFDESERDLTTILYTLLSYPSGYWGTGP